MDELFKVFGAEEPEDDAQEEHEEGEIAPPPEVGVIREPPAKRARREARAAQTAEAQGVEVSNGDFIKVDKLSFAGKRMLDKVVVDTFPEEANCVHECVRPEGYEYPPVPTGPSPRTYAFKLDTFQVRATEAIAKNESVLVAAHTSAGKTAVAEYAIATCIRDNKRLVYTSPIKALSNQKFRDLTEDFKDVGLMTGDVTINPNASIMVMTTEVLRNMLFKGSDLTREAAWIVFDEVHYMRDPDRGVVWEEVMILLSDTVRMAFLSATIPNAREFAEWICRVKHQPCHVVYTDYRPVPLQHYLFPAGGDGVFLVVNEKGEFQADNFARAAASASQTALDAKTAVKQDKSTQEEQEATDLEKLLNMCSEKSYLPVIVFSFSRKVCETSAMAMAKHDLTTSDEKKLIDEIFNSAVMTLGEEDKKLPQLSQMLALVRRGFGVHHGGLLPILKEIVELLFQENLLKVLFATETFAMGINMPAKTVVFTNVKKYDGQAHRLLNGGEYIQMAGRAGRRGKDDKGICIMMWDQKVDQQAAKGLFMGSADRLISAFHLKYNMLLNMTRVEGADPEYIIERSFYQFQKDRAVGELEKEKEHLEKELEANADLREVLGDEGTYSFDPNEAVAEMWVAQCELDEVKARLRAITNEPANLGPFLNVGRLLYLNDTALAMEWGWGFLVNATKVRTKESEVEGKQNMSWVLDVFVKCEPGTFEAGYPAPVKKDSVASGHVITASIDLVQLSSKIRANLPSIDLRAPEGRRIGVQLLDKILAHPTLAKTGPPLLDPVTDMKIKDKEVPKLVKRQKAAETKLAENPIRGHPRADEYIAAFKTIRDARERIRELKTKLDASQYMVLKDELKGMRRVLKRLEFVNKEMVVGMKGQLACEISTSDEVLISELIVQNVFEKLSGEEIISLLSCLSLQGKVTDKQKKKTTNSQAVLNALERCKTIARTIAKTKQESKLVCDIEEYVANLHPLMADLVLEWLDGRPFGQIMSTTGKDFFEGEVVRTVRRLDDLVLEVIRASNAIGDEVLATKLKETQEKLHRGIAFAASLYL
mmetsp:Transcript_40266/g.96492  ORF Transcript_40266/g.96492 Transcript_40266/m.96492 type:complete len:1049 (-) Transcript_40266:146-3292(-)